MFEMLMLIGFTYAGFCYLLPKGELPEENEEEGTRVRRDEPARMAGQPALMGIPLLAAPRRRTGCDAAEPRRCRCRR